MFRALAEFIMRGRIPAISIALIGSLVPLLTQAVIGLVTLRKGRNEGFIIGLWALMPSVVALWRGEVGTTIVFVGMAVIIVSYCTSWTLRYTVSWPATLMATIAYSTLAAIIVFAFAPDITQELAEFFDKLAASGGSDKEVDGKLKDWVLAWDANKVTSMFAFWIAVSVIAGILVARWWQAILFNPGGFRQEMHGLRLNPPVATVCIVSLGYSVLRGSDYQFWANLFSLPLLIAGLGLIHCAIAKYRVGLGALAAMYVVLFLVPPIGLIISIIGFSDVWLDFRKRFNLAQ